MDNLNTGESAFTLLEILVVMTLVAILTAFAIPQYSSYKKKAFDLRAQNDLRNAALAEEAYFLESEAYLSCKDAACLQLPGLGALSDGVTLSMNALDTGFTGEASHPKGSGKIFRWDSDKGGMLRF